MADLTNILGGSWEPPIQQGSVIYDSPEVQMHDAMVGAGLTPPNSIIMDGRVHRFNSGTKGKGGHDKSGWYVAFGDGVPAGRFGCFRAGVEVTFRAQVSRPLTSVDEMAITRRMSEARALRDAELAKAREVAADTVSQIWTDGMAASADHPYLARKGIGSHGARVTGDGRLMIPLYTADGELASLQYISADGEKRYHPSGMTKGCFLIIGEAKGRIFIAEGFATAATIHEQTGDAVAVAFSAGNLPATAEAMRELADSLVVVADNDASGVGRSYAEQACAKTGARFVMPPTPGDANDYHQSGGDLSLLIDPPTDDWLVHADDFCQQPAPIKWLVKRWVQQDALIMVHGPSGGGKTFFVIDLCMSMATGKAEWSGLRVKPASVVYLAGEGHSGLRARVAAWRVAHGGNRSNMWLSRSGCDLNTLEGYQHTVAHVRSLATKPDLIVVDTLHRFMAGDENSAQDAKTMLDACGNLMREFSCSVMLVHHTGVSDEAQHRARGSSAWRGALDIEISVVPAKDDKPMEIIQRKSKDAELAKDIFCELKSVDIPGWFDEDGEQVNSAIIEITEGEPKQNKKDSKLQGHIKTFERAWWHGGAETRNDYPYVSRSAMKEMLAKDGLAERTVTNKLDSSRDDMIGMMINGEVIAPHEHGWIMLDEVQASAMMMARK